MRGLSQDYRSLAEYEYERRRELRLLLENEGCPEDYYEIIRGEILSPDGYLYSEKLHLVRLMPFLSSFIIIPVVQRLFSSIDVALVIWAACAMIAPSIGRVLFDHMFHKNYEAARRRTEERNAVRRVPALSAQKVSDGAPERGLPKLLAHEVRQLRKSHAQVLPLLPTTPLTGDLVRIQELFTTYVPEVCDLYRSNAPGLEGDDLQELDDTTVRILRQMGTWLNTPETRALVEARKDQLKIYEMFVESISPKSSSLDFP